MSPGSKKSSRRLPPPDLQIKGLIETSFIDWKGHLSMVMFTGGCNFRCPFCHNSTLVLHPDSLGEIPLEHILARLAKFRKWIDRVVVTGGEPTIHRGLEDFLVLLKKRHFKIKLDTNGSHPEMLKRVVGKGLVDYVAMDVKGPIETYHRWSGVRTDPQKIAESVDFLLEGHVDYEFRMTVVPFLHREQDVYNVAERVKSGRRFFIQDFVPRDTVNSKYASVRPFSPEKMRTIRETVDSILQNAAVYSHLH